MNSSLSSESCASVTPMEGDVESGEREAPVSPSAGRQLAGDQVEFHLGTHPRNSSNNSRPSSGGPTPPRTASSSPSPIPADDSTHTPSSAVTAAVNAAVKTYPINYGSGRPFTASNREYPFITSTRQQASLVEPQQQQENERLRKMKDKKERKVKNKDKNVRTTYEAKQPDGYNIDQVLKSIGEPISSEKPQKKNQKSVEKVVKRQQSIKKEEEPKPPSTDTSVEDVEERKPSPPTPEPKAKTPEPPVQSPPLTTSQSSSSILEPDIGNYRSVVVVEGDLKRPTSKSQENLSSFTKVTKKQKGKKKSVPDATTEHNNMARSRNQRGGRQQHHEVSRTSSYGNHDQQQQQQQQQPQQQPPATQQKQLPKPAQPPPSQAPPAKPQPALLPTPKPQPQSALPTPKPQHLVLLPPPKQPGLLPTPKIQPQPLKSHQKPQPLQTAPQVHQMQHPPPAEILSPISTGSGDGLDLTTDFPPLEAENGPEPSIATNGGGSGTRRNNKSNNKHQGSSAGGAAWPSIRPSSSSPSDHHQTAVIPRNKASDPTTSSPSTNNSYSSAVMGAAAQQLQRQQQLPDITAHHTIVTSTVMPDLAARVPNSHHHRGGKSGGSGGCPSSSSTSGHNTPSQLVEDRNMAFDQRALNGNVPPVTIEGYVPLEDSSSSGFEFGGPVNEDLLSKDSLHHMDKAIVSFGSKMEELHIIEGHVRNNSHNRGLSSKAKYKAAAIAERSHQDIVNYLNSAWNEVKTMKNVTYY